MSSDVKNSSIPAAAAAAKSAAAGPVAASFPSLSSLRCPVVLGSSSKWRARVVREMGIALAGTLNPDIDEKAVRVPGQSTHADRLRQRAVEQSSMEATGD